MTDWPHHPPVHRRVTALRSVIVVAALVIAAMIAFTIWDRWVPSERYLFAEATEQLRSEFAASGTVGCQTIEPVRGEQRAGADAWFICRHSGNADGEAHLFFWFDRIEGQRGVFGGRPINIEGNPLWKL